MKKSHLLPLLLLSATLVACQPQTEEAENTNQTNSEAQEVSVEQTVPGAENQEDMVAESDTVTDEDTDEMNSTYNINMTNFAFSVTEMEAKPGATLTLNLTNSEGNHDLVIDELDIHSEHLDEGETDTMTITIPEDVEPGTEYEYYCSVGRHREMGMVGTLTIIE